MLIAAHGFAASSRALRLPWLRVGRHGAEDHRIGLWHPSGRRGLEPLSEEPDRVVAARSLFKHTPLVVYTHGLHGRGTAGGFATTTSRDAAEGHLRCGWDGPERSRARRELGAAMQAEEAHVRLVASGVIGLVRK
eukprot:7096953-Prymnesium_polylepis.2